MILWRRLIRAARLDPMVYEEVEADRSCWWQAVFVVALASLGMGTGTIGRIGPIAAFYSVAYGLFAWTLWAGLAFVVGVRLLPTPKTYATWGQLLRTTAFAMGPGILGLFGIIPALTGIVVVVAGVWILIAFVVAVRQALDYESTLRAVAVCIVGWALFFGLFLTLTW